MHLKMNDLVAYIIESILNLKYLLNTIYLSPCII